MGLGYAFLERLVELKRQGSMDGFTSVIEIGSQQLSDTFIEADELLDQLYSLFGRKRVSLGAPKGEAAVGGVEILHPASPPSRIFWQSIGFEYRCIDFDGHRDSFPLDLNKDPVPKDMRAAFDLVVNAGTSEHVANQDHAFRVMHELCRKGGIMTHDVPAGGVPNHGLFNYNLKFFWLLCRENGYKPLFLRLSAHGSQPIPENITDSNEQYGTDGNLTDYKIPDLSIIAALRKTSNAPFVTPLDIPTDLVQRSEVRRVLDKLLSKVGLFG